MGSGHRESVSTCLFRIEDALEFFASNFLPRPEGSCQFVGLPIAQHLLEVAWEAGLGLSKGWSGAFRARLGQARCWVLKGEQREAGGERGKCPGDKSILPAGSRDADSRNGC